MTPFAEIENVSLPAVTLTPGSPNRCWSAGARMKGPFRPVCTSVKEPSGWPKNFPGPFSGTVMAFPVCRFVYETVTAPVKRNVMDPSAVLRTLVNSLLTGKVTRSLNPQTDAGRVKGGPEGGSHLGPRPARAGEAVATPPSTHSSALSATIITSRRLMAITPLRPPRWGLRAILQRRARGSHSRCTFTTTSLGNYQHRFYIAGLPWQGPGALLTWARP